MTNNLFRRTAEHKYELVPGFSARYRIHRLVHVEMFTDVWAAISREKQIKAWRREKKIALIEKDNPSWGDLAENWFPKSRAHADPSPRLDCNRSSG
jgi:putative endonuclease